MITMDSMDNCIDLGQAQLRRVNVNYLRQAYSNRCGVVWFDGECLWHMQIRLQNHQLQGDRTAAVNLGQFRDVSSIAWSRHPDGILAVTHESKISIFQFSESDNARVEKLIHVLTTDICSGTSVSIKVSVVVQGCFWHPSLPIITFVSSRMVDLYNYSLADHSYKLECHINLPNKINSLSKITWLASGLALICAIGDTLVLFRWSNLPNHAMKEYIKETRKLENLSGNIRCILPVIDDHHFIVSAELPLEKLCMLSQSDYFDEEMACSSSSTLREENNSQSDMIDLTHLRSDGLPKKACAQISLLSIHGDSCDQISSIDVLGFITPDILDYNDTSKSIILSSNSTNLLHIFAIVKENNSYAIAKRSTMELLSDSRAKGICFIRENIGLLLIGQLEKDFLTDFMSLKTIVNKLFVFINEVDVEVRRSMKEDLLRRLIVDSGNSFEDSIFPVIRNPAIDTLITDNLQNTNLMNFVSKPSNTELDYNNPSEIPANIGKYEILTSIYHIANIFSTLLNVIVPLSSDKLFECMNKLECLIQTQAGEVSRIAEEVIHLSKFITEKPNKVELNASVIQVTLQTNGNDVSKNFLLNDGMLNVAVVEKAFGITNMEILIGNKWCIVSPTPDGYIPIKYSSNSAITITGFMEH
ncbi:WD repeat and coiled-coil-containing protein C2orf44 [Trichoplax sp. H2]|nr:WD repeat and coiled-coil-containing protein C2orf44 [Trichoplax sp. H2]|eukprot:RDD37234.1 WD repeat and coiled-coil-containing protein C2orf44 [Trichoplax sp. H2]